MMQPRHRWAIAVGTLAIIVGSGLSLPTAASAKTTITTTVTKTTKVVNDAKHGASSAADKKKFADARKRALAKVKGKKGPLHLPIHIQHHHPLHPGPKKVGDKVVGDKIVGDKHVGTH